jgi:hypothetical protein
MEKRVNLCILELFSVLNFRSEEEAWAPLCHVSLSVHRINDVLAAYRAVPGRSVTDEKILDFIFNPSV